MSEERNVFFKLGAFFGHRMLVKEALDDLAAEDRLFDDFRDVFHFNVAVEESTGLEADQRSFLAETLAAGLGDVGRIVKVKGFCALRGQFDSNVFTVFFQLFDQSVANLQGSVGDTAGFAADDDSPFQCRFTFFKLFGNLFQIWHGILCWVRC